MPTLRIAILLASLAVGVVGCAPPLAPANPAPSADVMPPIDSARGDERLELWRADVDTFEAWMRSRHGGLFAVMSERDFAAALASLRADLPALRDDEIVVRLQAIATMVGSGHTCVRAGRGTLAPSRLPIDCLWLEDGILVTATHESSRSLAGTVLIGINEVAIADVMARVATVTPHENETYLHARSMEGLLTPETLTGLGLAEPGEPFRIVARERDGRFVQTTLVPWPAGEPLVLESAVGANVLSFTRMPRPDGQPYGSILDHASNEILYVWYDTCSDQAGRTVAEFARDTLERVDRDRPRAVVVDLRRNGGGNSALLEPLIDGLAARRWLNTPETLAVLIGPRTFSSAGLNTQHFRERTSATIVGSPTGQRPNSWLECRSDWLPNTLLCVTYMLIAPSFAPEIPDSYEPDVLAPMTCEAWRAGRDPAYEAAVARAPAR